MTLNAGSAGVEQPVGWPRRFTIILFFFTCTLILYIDRVSISVVAPVLMKEFGWDEAMMGTILSAFFVGYLFTQLPGGLIADRFGGKGILGFAVLWWSHLYHSVCAYGSADDRRPDWTRCWRRRDSTGVIQHDRPLDSGW